MRGARRKAAKSESPRATVLLAGTLKGWRLKQRFFLKEMAADLGVSVSTVEGWESGHRFPSGSHLTRLSDYTGLPVCKLFCVKTGDCLLSQCASGCCPNAATLEAR